MNTVSSHWGNTDKEQRLIFFENPEHPPTTVEHNESKEQLRTPSDTADELQAHANTDLEYAQNTMQQSLQAHPEVRDAPDVRAAEQNLHTALGNEMSAEKQSDDVAEKGVEEHEEREQEEKQPTTPEAPPRTNAERIDRDLSEAEKTLKDSSKEAWERLRAAISYVLLVIERIKMQIAGTLDDPLEKNKDSEDSNESNEDKEENSEGSETSAEMSKRLRAEVATHPHGVDGLIDDKDQEIRSELQENNADIDELESKIKDLKTEKQGTQAKIDEQKQIVADIDQTLAGNPGEEQKSELNAEKEKALAAISDLEVDMKAIDEKIGANEKRRADMIGGKGNEKTKTLQAEVDALEKMKEDAKETLEKLRAGLILAATEISRQLGGRVPFLQDLQNKLTVEMDEKTLTPYVHVEQHLRDDLVKNVTEKGSEEEKALTDDLQDGRLNDVDALTIVLKDLQAEAQKV